MEGDWRKFSLLFDADGRTYRQTDNWRALTEALALIGCTVNIDLGADNVAEGQKHLRQFGVAEHLRQVIDEEITAFRTDRRRRSLVHGSCRTQRTHRSPRNSAFLLRAAVLRSDAYFYALMRRLQLYDSTAVRRRFDGAFDCSSKVVKVTVA